MIYAGCWVSQRGVIALTKIDRVDADDLELARLEIEEFVEGSFLDTAPLIPVSARTGRGLAELKAALSRQQKESLPKIRGSISVCLLTALSR